MDNQNQPLTKELLIKRFLLVVGGAVAFATIVLFFTYGRIPIKPFLIGLVILLSIMVVNAIVVFKYKEKIAKNQNIFSYLLIIIGIGMIITSIKEGNYIQIGIGLILLFYGIKQIKKS